MREPGEPPVYKREGGVYVRGYSTAVWLHFVPWVFTGKGIWDISIQKEDPRTTRRPRNGRHSNSEEEGKLPHEVTWENRRVEVKSWR